jgi:hypothetical protein
MNQSWKIKFINDLKEKEKINEGFENIFKECNNFYLKR